MISLGSGPCAVTYIFSGDYFGIFNHSLIFQAVTRHVFVLLQTCLWLMFGWVQTECIKLFYLEECPFCCKWPQASLLVLSRTTSFINVMWCTFGSLRQWLEMFNNFQCHYGYSICPSALLLESHPSWKIRKKKYQGEKLYPAHPFGSHIQGSPDLHTWFAVPWCHVAISTQLQTWQAGRITVLSRAFPTAHGSQLLSSFPVLPCKGISHPHQAGDSGQAWSVSWETQDNLPSPIAWVHKNLLQALVNKSKHITPNTA